MEARTVSSHSFAKYVFGTQVAIEILKYMLFGRAYNTVLQFSILLQYKTPPNPPHTFYHLQGSKLPRMHNLVPVIHVGKIQNITQMGFIDYYAAKWVLCNTPKIKQHKWTSPLFTLLQEWSGSCRSHFQSSPGLARRTCPVPLWPLCSVQSYVMGVDAYDVGECFPFIPTLELKGDCIWQNITIWEWWQWRRIEGWGSELLCEILLTTWHQK